jgi:hypothetical protein
MMPPRSPLERIAGARGMSRRHAGGLWGTRENGPGEEGKRGRPPPPQSPAIHIDEANLFSLHALREF